MRFAGSLTPGSALDIGSGEGADAVWMAALGWTVVGVEPAPSAVARAQQAARAAGVHVEFREGLFPEALGADRFDLVSCCYGVLPRTDAIVRALTAAVRPGGQVLVVHHDMPEEQSAEVAMPVWLAGELEADFSVIEVQRHSRSVAAGAGAHHHTDVVLTAQRPARP